MDELHHGGQNGTQTESERSSAESQIASTRRDSPELRQRLNQVATILIGATAAVSSLFALLGANSDRIWVALDDSGTKKLLAVTVVLSLAAIVFALYSLLAKSNERAGQLLLGGSVAFIGSLVFATWTSAHGANQYARPAFSAVTLERTAGAGVLAFRTQTASLDDSQRIGVRVTDIEKDRILFDATLAPDDMGVAEQNVELRLPTLPASILLAAWHRDDSPGGTAQPRCDIAEPPDGTACIFVRP